MTGGDLHRRLLDAHARNDRAMLVRLYSEAATLANSLDASCFFLTHAYVHALELGDPQSKALHAQLREHGREE